MFMYNKEYYLYNSDKYIVKYEEKDEAYAIYGFIDDINDGSGVLIDEFPTAQDCVDYIKAGYSGANISVIEKEQQNSIIIEEKNDIDKDIEECEQDILFLEHLLEDETNLDRVKILEDDIKQHKIKLKELTLESLQNQFNKLPFDEKMGDAGQQIVDKMNEIRRSEISNIEKDADICI